MRALSACVLFIGSVIALVQPTPASAVTAEVAKACSTQLEKAFPPKEPGNPAAGSSSGTPEDHRRYFEKCVANGGRVDDTPQSDQKADQKPDQKAGK